MELRLQYEHDLAKTGAGPAYVAVCLRGILEVALAEDGAAKRQRIVGFPEVKDAQELPPVVGFAEGKGEATLLVDLEDRTPQELVALLRDRTQHMTWLNKIDVATEESPDSAVTPLRVING